MRNGVSFRKRIAEKAHAYARDTAAATLVEMALMLPFFLLFLLLIVEMSFMYYATSAVEQAAFNYSRRLTDMTAKGQPSERRNEIMTEIVEFVGSPLIERFRFEIGSATERTDFTAKLTRNIVNDFVKDKSKPIYFRLVATRRSPTYVLFQPLWDAVINQDNTGLFSDIDVLIVIPWPAQDETNS